MIKNAFKTYVFIYFCHCVHIFRVHLTFCNKICEKESYLRKREFLFDLWVNGNTEGDENCHTAPLTMLLKYTSCELHSIHEQMFFNNSASVYD